MWQLIAIIVSFLLIPVFLKCKLKLSYTLFITSGILSILTGLGLSALGQSTLNIFIEPSLNSTVLTVLMVSILGGLMKYYRILDKIVDSMLAISPNKKLVLMIIPALVGVLVIPGGALLSAPFIYNIGEEIDIKPVRRAAINLVFRHMAMFILPYSTSILIISATLPHVNIFRVILFNMIFVVATVLVGYFFYLRDIKTSKTTITLDRRKEILKLIIYTSPFYIPVIINALTGLPFYITLLASIFVVFILSNKKKFFRMFFFSINWGTILTVIAILIIKELILQMEDVLLLFENMLDTNNGFIYTLFIIFLISVFFGLTTGNQGASLAIILPMISQLDVSINAFYVYLYFIYASAFLGYFFSTLHLCQVFTLELMRVTTGELYKEYKIFALVLFIVLITSTIVLKLAVG